ncbi:uncharacterized protein B0T15DRAFT_260022 [Chaetomium strumarium]|uniref:Uncharacterized protein n=1 Tax=Chaetomium strumarium TaxID=1170767 RepID=A0AAJ0GNE9_9PEZI|nr:hypothetical protein B0T15DRAFT_260022 [Chaetomium strumarium]
MTSTSMTAAASATSTACGGALVYDIPVQDASCAMPFGGNHTDIMAKCCGSADVVSYYNNCGLFCLSQDQTVRELMDCLFKEGAADNAVFCRGNTTASATGSATDLPASASASVVATGGSGAKTSGGTSGTASGSGSAATSTTSDNAAPGSSVPSFGNGFTGLAIGALLFSATAFGALGL